MGTEILGYDSGSVNKMKVDAGGAALVHISGADVTLDLARPSIMSHAVATSGISATLTGSPMTDDWRLRQVIWHYTSGAPNENVTVTFKSSRGSEYDALLYSGSTAGATDLIFLQDGIVGSKLDYIQATAINSGLALMTIQALFEEV